MANAKSGDSVKVHYTGTLDDGSKFDSSVDREPMAFTIGQGQLLPMFEDAVVGLAVGESVNVSIPPENGYGLRREELIGQIPADKLPGDMTPAVGMQLQIQTPQGQPMILTITEVADAHVTVDGNHQLAGQNLHFEIKLVEIA
ncbi:peptidylprolyl isomerase [Desulfonema ishimotonii]|uniref:Peptidyl-prolyl cis-trans isomerase n=2 Tax=Desulfonema ishimotonii TaxID=45657 RepID=A0A401FQZ9_9BACT|nr:peptidylprolyl isomerase [Desulfonema ishimotonii]